MSEEYRRAEFHWGIVMLKTRRFQPLMDRLGRYRVTGPLAWFALYLMPVAAAIALYLELTQLGILLSPRGAQVAGYIRTLSPLANVLLPGINPYLPIVYGWLAIFVGMVIHEGAHGIVARSLGFPVKSSGLMFFLFVPIGAFVEIDDKVLKSSRARDSGRVLGAGVGVNFVLGVVCLLLLFSVVSSMEPEERGLAVVSVYRDSPQQHSPAYLAGLRPGDFITAVNGVQIDDPLQVLNSSWYRPGQLINLTLWRGGQSVPVNNVRLASITVLDTKTNTTSVRAFLGVEDVGYSTLKSRVSVYTTSFFRSPFLYFCIPTLPACQSVVPFSDSMVMFYRSPLGTALPAASNALYWLFFVNFNLAIFNALPIYPFDGGQAFEAGLRGLLGERWGGKLAAKLTTATSLVAVTMILFIILGPYLVY